MASASELRKRAREEEEGESTFIRDEEAVKGKKAARHEDADAAAEEGATDSKQSVPETGIVSEDADAPQKENILEDTENDGEASATAGADKESKTLDDSNVQEQLNEPEDTTTQLESKSESTRTEEKLSQGENTVAESEKEEKPTESTQAPDETGESKDATSQESVDKDAKANHGGDDEPETDAAAGNAPSKTETTESAAHGPSKTDTEAPAASEPSKSETTVVATDASSKTDAEAPVASETSKSESTEPTTKIESAPKVFGAGTAFGASTTSAFGQSVTEKAEDKAKDENKPEADKPEASKNGAVFGSGTKFGSGAIFGSGTSFGSRPLSSWGSAASESGSQSVFGGGITSSLAKPAVNIFDIKQDDKDQQKDSEENAEGDDDAEPPVNEDIYVKVAAPLQQKSVETGEEEENSVYSCRARLYALDLADSSSGWKERGTGTLHVNTLPDGSRSRLVMRADAVLRVILNLPLIASTTVSKGMKSSLASDKFVRVTGVEDSKPVQYALKAANPEVAGELYNQIDRLLPHN